MRDNGVPDKEIARLIYHVWMSHMKYTLDLEEYSYKESGRNDPRFKFFKKQLMANSYDQLRQLFTKLESLGISEKTSWPEDVKDGYKDTISGGSGFVNTPEMTDFLAERNGNR